MMTGYCCLNIQYRKWETIIHLFLVRDKNCSKFSYLVEENDEEKGLHE